MTAATSDTHEFVCMYTPSLKRKNKEWHDGYLRWHTFNYRAMLYDEARRLVDSKFFPGKAVSSDMELLFERHLVEVKEKTSTTQANLEHVIRPVSNTPAKRAITGKRLGLDTPRSGALQTPCSRTPLGLTHKNRIYPPCSSQTPLHARHILVEPRAMIPVATKAMQSAATRKRKVDSMLCLKNSTDQASKMSLPKTTTSAEQVTPVSRRPAAKPVHCILSSPSASPEPMRPTTEVQRHETAILGKAAQTAALTSQPSAAPISKRKSSTVVATAPDPGVSAPATESAADDTGMVHTARIVSLTRKPRGLLAAQKVSAPHVSRVPMHSPIASPDVPARLRTNSPECIILSDQPSPVTPKTKRNGVPIQLPDATAPHSANLESKSLETAKVATVRDKRRPPEISLVVEEEDDAFEETWQAYEAAQEALAASSESSPAQTVNIEAIKPNETAMRDAALDNAWVGIQLDQPEGFTQLVDGLLSSPRPVDNAPESLPDGTREAASPADELPDLIDDSLADQMEDETDLIAATPFETTASVQRREQQTFAHLQAIAPIAPIVTAEEIIDDDGFLPICATKQQARPKSKKRKLQIKQVPVESARKPDKFDHLLACYQLSQCSLTPPVDDGWQLPLATAPQPAPEPDPVSGVDTDDDEMDTTQERHIQKHLDLAARRIAAQSTLSRMNPQCQRGLARSKVPAVSLHKSSLGLKAKVVQLPKEPPSVVQKPVIPIQSARKSSGGKLVVEETLKRKSSGEFVPHKIVHRAVSATAGNPSSDCNKSLLQDQDINRLQKTVETAKPIAKRHTGLSRQGSLHARPPAPEAPMKPMREEYAPTDSELLLATQLAKRAPDFMSAKSLNAGAILGLDAPIAALDGMSAREVDHGFRDFTQSVDES